MAEKYNDLLLSDTLVPDIFMVRYMPMLKKDSIGLYLWSLMTFKKGSFTLDEANSYGVIPGEDIKDCLADLVASGLLVREGDSKFAFVDLKRVEVDAYIKHGVDEDGQPVFKSDEKSRNVLSNSIQKTYYLGNMQYMFYRLIDKCLYDYKFDDEVVYSLFEEGRDLRIHYKIQPMYDLASNWYEKGYITKDSLKDYYEYKKRRTSNEKLFGKLMRRRLNDLDIERIDKMTKDYCATPDLIEYAFKTLEWRGNITTMMVEDKIKEWFAAGISSIDKAVVYEGQRHQENKSKASRKRGKTNTRKSGLEAGIKVENETSNTDNQSSDAADDENQDVNDSILNMFSGDDI